MLDYTPAGDDGTYEIMLLIVSVSNLWMLWPSNEMSPAASGTIFSRAKHSDVLPDPCAPTMARRLTQGYKGMSHNTSHVARHTSHVTRHTPSRLHADIDM